MPSGTGPCRIEIWLAGSRPKQPATSKDARSIRPFAWGLRAPIQPMPASASARPTWVRLRVPVSCSLRVGGRDGLEFGGHEDPV